jgi:hypothetical protein
MATPKAAAVTGLRKIDRAGSCEERHGYCDTLHEHFAPPNRKPIPEQSADPIRCQLIAVKNAMDNAEHKHAHAHCYATTMGTAVDHRGNAGRAR